MYRPNPWAQPAVLTGPTTVTLPVTYPSIAPAPSGRIGEAFKAKKAGTNGSHVVLMLDESGSMGQLRQSTISSANEFISGQRKDAEESKINTVVSIYTFDGGTVRCIRDAIDVNEISDLTEKDYQPRGMTNLYDAMGSVIATINNKMSENKRKDRRSVIIAVLTDGMENSSTTFDMADINKMYNKCNESKWGFIFMGANIDAFAVGSQLGFNTHNTLQYAATSSGLTGSSASATRMVNSLKSGLVHDGNADLGTMYASTGFTDEERTKSMGDNNG